MRAFEDFNKARSEQYVTLTLHSLLSRHKHRLDFLSDMKYIHLVFEYDVDDLVDAFNRDSSVNVAVVPEVFEPVVALLRGVEVGLIVVVVHKIQR